MTASHRRTSAPAAFSAINRRRAMAGVPDERIYALWDALADFPAAETDAALLHLMKTLCGWLDADNAVWIGGVRMAQGAAAQRDPQGGWRARAVRHLVAVPERREMVARSMRRPDADPGMTTRAIMAEAGRFRVHRLRDGFIDFAAFRRTAHWQAFYEGFGITDRIWAAFPVNADVESHFLFDLNRARRRFSAADAALVAASLRGLKWFHRNLMLSHGLPLAGAPLAPAQRRLLGHLLTGRTEREIAAELGLTPGTTHQYAVELYRKLGVKGRTGLMVLWLAPQGGDAARGYRP